MCRMYIFVHATSVDKYAFQLLFVYCLKCLYVRHFSEPYNKATDRSLWWRGEGEFLANNTALNVNLVEVKTWVLICIFMRFNCRRTCQNADDPIARHKQCGRFFSISINRFG